MPLVPVREFTWTNDYSFMRELTCKNHQTAKYLTKNPFDRNLHLVKVPEGDIERTDTGECKCPFNDLMVIVKEEKDSCSQPSTS
jgi:hypothetical protein